MESLKLNFNRRVLTMIRRSAYETSFVAWWSSGRVVSNLLDYLQCRRLQKCGAPDGIRTHGPQIRNLVLYPAELRMQFTSIRAGAARGQFSSSGGTTWMSSGITLIPSSISALACAGVAWP